MTVTQEKLQQVVFLVGVELLEKLISTGDCGVELQARYRGQCYRLTLRTTGNVRLMFGELSKTRSQIVLSVSELAKMNLGEETLDVSLAVKLCDFNSANKQRLGFKKSRNCKGEVIYRIG